MVAEETVGGKRIVCKGKVCSASNSALDVRPVPALPGGARRRLEHEAAIQSSAIRYV